MFISEEDVIEFFDPEDKFSGFTKGWPLSSFETVMKVAFGYVVITLLSTTVMKVAPIPPIDPYPLKFVYNVSQIFICAYLSVKALIIAIENGYHFCCNEYNKHDPVVAEVMWIFYVTKMLDFFDTVFIVLGKKWRQLSFLHIYHHFSVLIICWLQLNVLYDGDAFLFVLLNAFVHTIMYTYYFICMHTKIPGSEKSLKIWWKSSLTMIQMIQFVTLMGSGVYSYFNDCPGYNHRLSSFCVCYTATLLMLFASFYSMSYRKNPSQKKNQ